jgi:hypothetical protein
MVEIKLDEDFLLVLKHDLHKVRTKNAVPHKDALKDDLMRKADGKASWMSRNFAYQEIDEISSFRHSLIFNNGKISREIRIKNKGELNNLFNEKDPYKLHCHILNSKLLNQYHEAKNYPYTSLKYHLLLTCAIFYNLSNSYPIEKLYLCENMEIESPFQIIFKDGSREWALLPDRGMSRVLPNFSLSWVRRTKTTSIGGEGNVLDGLLSQIYSWSCALATIEDYQIMDKIR